MRDIVQQEVNRFLAQELPRDESYYQRQNQEVTQLVQALEQLTKHHISWESPVDIFNFYHLQIPVDPILDLPLYSITTDDIQDLVAQKRSTSFLHLLISSFSRFVCIYWVRYFPPYLEESISTEIICQKEEEQQLVEQVQQILEKRGWLWLSSEEVSESVPEAPTPWPYEQGQVLALVRHLLFPGCGPLIDL